MSLSHPKVAELSAKSTFTMLAAVDDNTTPSWCTVLVGWNAMGVPKIPSELLLPRKHQHLICSTLPTFIVRFDFLEPIEYHKIGINILLN
jgi:hypothetical protein